MLKDIKITYKFPLVMIAFALISAMATGLIAYTNTANSMESAAEEKLIALLESRKHALQQYFDTVEHEVSFHAKSPLILNAITDFSRAWAKLPNNFSTLGVDSQQRYLQQLYISRNPYKTGQKKALLTANDNSEYSQFHRRYHPMFNNMIDAGAYYDFFLVTPQADIIYSVDKELDFATNLNRGPWKNTKIAKLFREIDKNPIADKLYFSDFYPYEPSHKEPASFIGSPIFNENFQYQGVAIFQLPIEPIDRIMQVTAGMGQSGETYLVAEDNLMRSNSRFFQDRSILITQVDTSSVRKALQGESGLNIIPDYRNITVFSAYTSIEFLGSRWAMIAEIDEAEVLAPVYSMSHFLLIGGILIALVISVIGYLLATDISQPIVTMTHIMNKLSNNELGVNISVGERKDEVGKMANAMVVFKENAIERDRLQQELIHLAEHDILTGVNTRQYAMNQLDHLLRKARINQNKLVLMFIDIDDFKLVNDIHGHPIGDLLLCDVASQLKRCISDKDIIARIGGDEFIIIIPDVINLSDSLDIANQIMANVRPRLPNVEKNAELTLSMGLSVFPDDASDVPSLLKKADSAMYEVKRKGKNSFNFWSSDTTDAT